MIESFEVEHEVNKISVQGISIWGLIRAMYISEELKEGNEPDGWNKTLKKQNPSKCQKVARLRNIAYGWKNLFNRNEVVIFSDKLELRKVGEKYVNRLTYPSLDQYLLVENSVDGEHITLKERKSQNVISLDLFSCFARIIPWRTPKIVSEGMLKELNKESGLSLDYKQAITKFFKYKIVFGGFLDIYKPKIVMVNCYYGPTYQALICASKERGIPIVEMQHGLISRTDKLYQPKIAIDRRLVPDYMFVFGESTKGIIPNNFVPQEKVIVVGNGYVEYLAGTGTRLERGQYKKKYARTIVVTAQYTVESKLVEFIRKAASLASDSLFLYVPRDATNKYEGIFPKNVRVITSSNAYELIKQADFHATVYSTCAMEAPFFGTPNILININGKSKECFEKVLTDPETTRYVNTEEEFVRLVSTWERLEPAEIKLRHKGFIQTGYVQEIKKAVERIGGKKDDM